MDHGPFSHWTHRSPALSVVDMVMCVAKPETRCHRGGSGFRRMKGEAAMKYGYRQLIMKTLVSAAIALVAVGGGAAPASADSSSFGSDPNPFSSLGCGCRETAPAGGPAVRDEIDRGIREGHYAQLPGLAAPTRARPPGQ